MNGEPPAQVVLVRAGKRTCAIPVGDVAETMRPLPVQPLAGVPAYVAGAAVVRGEATPVVNLDALLGGGPGGAPARFLLVRCGDRRAVLAVDDVIGVRALDAGTGGLEPLLAGAAEGAVAELQARDGALVVLLRTARAVPDEAFDAAAGARA